MTKVICPAHIGCSKKCLPATSNSSVIQTADSSLQSHPPHRLRLRASRPERLEPLSPFPIRLGLCINRLTLCRLRIVPRAFPAEFASRSRRSLLEGALDRNRPTFAPQAGESGRSLVV